MQSYDHTYLIINIVINMIACNEMYANDINYNLQKKDFMKLLLMLVILIIIIVSIQYIH